MKYSEFVDSTVAMELERDVNLLQEAYDDLMKSLRAQEAENVHLQQRNIMLEKYIEGQSIALPRPEDSVWYKPFLKKEKHLENLRNRKRRGREIAVENK